MNSFLYTIMDIKFSRQWCMSNKETFSILPITELIQRYISKEKVWIDPFVGNSIFKNDCKYTNDLNRRIPASYHLEALDFLKRFKEKSIDGVLFDPPFSPRQISECYKSVGKKVYMKTTQSSFWGNRKKEVARIVKCGGIVICCGWNSGGIGETLGFQILEILLVPHGGHHNDTIVTVEQKEK